MVNGETRRRKIKQKGREREREVGSCVTAPELCLCVCAQRLWRRQCSASHAFLNFILFKMKETIIIKIIKERIERFLISFFLFQKVADSSSIVNAGQLQSQ